MRVAWLSTFLPPSLSDKLPLVPLPVHRGCPALVLYMSTVKWGMQWLDKEMLSEDAPGRSDVHCCHWETESSTGPGQFTEVLFGWKGRG